MATVTAAVKATVPAHRDNNVFIFYIAQIVENTESFKISFSR